MSASEVNELKSSYIESIDTYIGEQLSAIKLAPRGAIKSSDYCDTLLLDVWESKEQILNLLQLVTELNNYVC
jgi:hypothetical protein